MSSLIAYTKQALIERVQRHMTNGWPTTSFSTTPAEILLYIDQAAAPTMVGQAYQGAKIDGNIAVPEAWYTTYQLPATKQDIPSGYWYSTLPQPPVSLPLGYSINRVYAASNGDGQSLDFLPIEAKRVGMREYLPKPPGARYWVTGDKIWLASNDGGSLDIYTVYAEMMKSRTESLSETLNMPDDAIELIFQNVVAKIKDRMGIPKDIIVDDLPAGNKTS
jgi:hypothetical protein